MNDSIEVLPERHVGGKILIDTNIALLHFIGRFDSSLVKSFKRTASFAAEDYETLSRLLSLIPNIVTTPHVLTEVSNLSGQLGDPKKTEFFGWWVRQFASLDERFSRSAELVEQEWFPKIGLTDAAILALAGTELLVLTDDFRFSNFLASAGADYINFNHLRVLNW